MDDSSFQNCAARPFHPHLSDVQTMNKALTFEERQRRSLAGKVLSISISKLNEDDNLRSNQNRSPEPGLHKRLLVTQALRNVASKYLPEDLPGLSPETDLENIIYNSIKKTENLPENDIINEYDILNEFFNNNEIVDKCLSEMIAESEEPEVVEMCNLDDGTITIAENPFTGGMKRKVPMNALHDEDVKRMKLSDLNLTCNHPESSTNNNESEVEPQFSQIINGMKGGLNALSPDDICDFLCDKTPSPAMYMESVQTLSSLFNNNFSLCSQQFRIESLNVIDQHYQSASSAQMTQAV